MTAAGAAAPPPPPPAVVDVFLYNGEPLLLFRLAYLEHVVTKFVVVEAKTTFSGRTKAHFYLDTLDVDTGAVVDRLRRANKWVESKLDRLPLPATFNHRSRRGRNATIEAAWARERYQRNYVLHHIANITGGAPYVMMCMDVDEIPRQDYVALLPQAYSMIHSPLRLEMRSFFYSFRWRHFYSDDADVWYKPFVATDQVVAEFFTRDRTLDTVRTSPASFTYLRDAGWHCSFCLPADHIVRTIHSFSRLELDRAPYTNVTLVHASIDAGAYLFTQHFSKSELRERSCVEGGGDVPTCPACAAFATLAYLFPPRHDQCGEAASPPPAFT
jgi:hypothetical protein